jgi:hypothetical protein
MNIYAGNLSRDAVDEDLRRAFEVFGQVSSARVILNKFTDVSRGFGFVEMPVETEARAARPLTVNEARPRPEDRRGGEGRGNSRRD